MSRQHDTRVAAELPSEPTGGSSDSRDDDNDRCEFASLRMTEEFRKVRIIGRKNGAWAEHRLQQLLRVIRVHASLGKMTGELDRCWPGGTVGP